MHGKHAALVSARHPSLEDDAKVHSLTSTGTGCLSVARLGNY